MKEEISLKGCLDYLINQCKLILSPYDEIIKSYPDFVFNTICDEIAEDWDNKYYINRLYNNKIINTGLKELYENIDRKFLLASSNMPNYDKDIWKTESLQNHPFWITQRFKIKELLSLLEQINL